MEILEYATGCVDHASQNAIDEEDDWIGLMQRIGLTSNFQSRLMHPEFTEIRLTRSLKEWVTEMMTMRYEFLETLDDVIKTPARGVHRRVSRLELDGKLASSGPEVLDRHSSIGKAPQMGIFKPEPLVATKIPEPPSEIEDHKMFYKGGSLTRLQSVHISGNLLNFGALASTPPGEFSPDFRGLYLTKQPQVAWEYAQWAAKLVDGNVVPVGVLQVAVPIHLLSSNTELSEEDWRRYVWACRLNEPQLHPIPKDLKYVETFQWIIGPLCRPSTHKVNKMMDKSELTI